MTESGIRPDQSRPGLFVLWLQCPTRGRLPFVVIVVVIAAAVVLGLFEQQEGRDNDRDILHQVVVLSGILRTTVVGVLRIVTFI